MTGLLAQLVTAAVLLLAVLGTGCAAVRAVGRRLPLDRATGAALVLVLGLGAVGVLTYLLGALHLVGGSTVPLLGAVGAVVLLRHRRWVRRHLVDAVRAAAAETRVNLVLAVLCGATLTLFAVAALAPPLETDEVQYHWPAALDWAASGTWTASPYRHVNGFPLMEVVYTAAATRSSWVAAHLLHLTAFVGLALGAGGLSTRLGARSALPVTAAVLALSTAATQSYLAYNDVAAAAFAVLAVVVLHLRRGSWTAALLCAGMLVLAVSVKPNTAVAAGAAGLVLIAGSDRWPGVWRDRRLLGQLAVVGGAAVLTLGAWTLRRWLVTGDVLDPVLAGPQSADALSRTADGFNKLILPLVPVIGGAMGQLQPWGGRTGLTLLVFLPVAAVLVVRRRAWRNSEVVLAGAAMVSWLALGYAAPPRTRLSIAAWCLLLVACRVALERHTGEFGRRRGVEWLWVATVVVSMVDNGFEAVRAASRAVDTRDWAVRASPFGDVLSIGVLLLLVVVLLLRVGGGQFVGRTRPQRSREPVVKRGPS